MAIRASVSMVTFVCPDPIRLTADWATCIRAADAVWVTPTASRASRMAIPSRSAPAKRMAGPSRRRELSESTTPGGVGSSTRSGR